VHAKKRADVNCNFQTKVHVVNLNMVTGRKHKTGSCHSPAICWSAYKSYTPQFTIQIFRFHSFSNFSVFK